MDFAIKSIDYYLNQREIIDFQQNKNDHFLGSSHFGIFEIELNICFLNFEIIEALDFRFSNHLCSMTLL